MRSPGGVPHVIVEASLFAPPSVPGHCVLQVTISIDGIAQVCIDGRGGVVSDQILR